MGKKIKLKLQRFFSEKIKTTETKGFEASMGDITRPHPSSKKKRKKK